MEGESGTPASSVGEYYGGDIPWVSISDMTKGGRLIVSTERSLTGAGLAHSAAQIPRRHSIVRNVCITWRV